MRGCFNKVKKLIGKGKRFAKRIYKELKRKMFMLVPDDVYLKRYYYKRMGRKLNLKNPETYTEKLQWLKLHDRNPAYTMMVDKYAVKQYVSQIIGEKYIIPTLGVWDSFNEIDFNSLPEEFVLKCTHDSGGIVICADKSKFDRETAKKKLNESLKNNYYWGKREWPYKDVRPRIIAEKYMGNGNGEGLEDYKFFCMNGTPRFLYLSKGLHNHETAKISYVTLDWKKAEFHRMDYLEYEELPPKPENLEDMILLAKKLSKGIPFVRVDFYNIGGKVFFGELTFTPGGGFTKWEPENWDKKLGEYIDLRGINEGIAHTF